MTLKQILAELPSFTMKQRRLLMQRLFELEDPKLPPPDLAVVEARLAELRRNPAAALSSQEMKARIRRARKI